jgi:transforming growth factor-beta-induced protein
MNSILSVRPSLRSAFGRGRALALATLAAGIALAACDDSDPAGPEPEPTIAAIVADEPAFSTLLAGLEAAGLTAALDDESATFTVFAPSNDAFGPLDLDVLLSDPDGLESVLLYHVVAGAAVGAGDLQDGQTIATLAGEQLTVRIADGNVFIDGSLVVTADVQAGNGIIHVIDRTLTGSRNMASVVGLLDDTRALLDAVVAAGIAGAFVDADAWTVFAPDNAAFAAVADVVAGLTNEQLQAVLQYHVIPSGIVDSATLLGLLADNGGEVAVTTAQGEELTITLVNPSTVSLNGGQATLDLANLDYFASNGIVHLMDGVVLPPSFTAALER